MAFVVCTALDDGGIVAVLTGGSAAAFYTAQVQSNDIDFVLRFVSAKARPDDIIAQLGFRLNGQHYVHPNTQYTLDFPPGPLSIGSDRIDVWDTVERDAVKLHVLSRTDSTRDRLAAFYHWNDRSSLQSALAVGSSGDVDLERIRAWSIREKSADRFEEFAHALARRSGSGS